VSLANPASNVSDSLFSVLIVNFNGQHHLRACLAALAVQSFPRHRYEVIVVDNGSTDGSQAMVRSEFPSARLVQLTENTGFSGGNNAGLPYAHGRYIVLLNNDTFPDPHWLAELAAEVKPGAAAASKLVFADDPTALNSGGLQLLRDGRGFDRGFRTRDIGQCEHSRAAFAACGAAVVLDREAIGPLLFDPKYFMYYEDLDAAWRGQLAGRTMAYAARSLVRHVHGGSAGADSPMFRFHVERNRTLTSVRNADPFLAVWSVVGQAARLARSVVRSTRGSENWLLTYAAAKALVSLVRNLPSALAARYFIRHGSFREPTANHPEKS
jgi:GT2 family glycosyltransferase